MKFWYVCFLGYLLPALSTTALAQSAYGTDAWAIERGDAGRGESLFRQHCLACHRADSLAKVVFPPEAVESNKICAFLQTHGATDEAQDCDLIAYLSRVAAEQWNKIEMEGR